jgi:hypothetical protein
MRTHGTTSALGTFGMNKLDAGFQQIIRNGRRRG